MNEQVQSRWSEIYDRLLKKIEKCDHPYIIGINCARSGSKYFQTLCQYAGLSVTHYFTPGDDGIVSDIAAGWELSEGCSVIHIVREPVKQIASALTCHDGTWEWIREFIDVESPDPLVRGMKYWLNWNKLCQGKAGLTFRVENIRARWPEVSEALGVKGASLPELPQDINTRKTRFCPITLEMLAAADSTVFNDMMKLARSYGY